MNRNLPSPRHPLAPALAIALLLLSSSSALASSFDDIPRHALLELTRGGELVHLPDSGGNAFHGVVVTRTPRPCDAVYASLTDVERYPELWPEIARVRVTEKTPAVTRYEMEVDLPMAPKLSGVVEHPAGDTVVFHDLETGGRFRYLLRDTGGGCQVRYHLQQPAGRRSGFVRVVAAIDPSATDTAELAGALATVRGVTRPEEHPLGARGDARAAARAFAELSSTGIVIRTLHRPGRPVSFVGARRVSSTPEEVLARLRDRPRYATWSANVKDVEMDGAEVDWSFGFLGGRVDVETVVEERGDLHAQEGVTLTERVTGGDLRRGLWRWTVRAVDGGAEVRLYMDLDVAEGSHLLRPLAERHDAFRSAVAMQVFVSLLRDVPGGDPLRRPRLAKR